jgi:hypothetical protein
MTRNRGAVLVETALFVSAALVFMLGIIQIGVLGFLQLTTDAAAYFDARANVLTVSAGTPEQATNLAFPPIAPGDIVAVAVPAPSPTIPVDYGYNGTAVQQASAQVQRHGGAAMMQPEQEQSTVSVPGVAEMLGQSLGVNGQAIEPKWVECGTHDDIAGAACSLASPPPNSQNNYFTQGENTPPYFVGFDFMQQCAGQVQPWGVYTGANPQTYGDGWTSKNGGGGGGTVGADWDQGPCANGGNNGNSSIGFIAMGTAEFLDSTNWGDKTAGIGGACDPLGGQSQSFFEAAAYHQRVYATIALFLETYPQQYMLELQSQEGDSKVNPDNQFASWNVQGQYPAGSGNIAIPEHITSFANWEGFVDSADYPGTGDQYNKAVQTVYSWDVQIGQGNPPSDPTYNNPTHPDLGCT